MAHECPDCGQACYCDMEDVWCDDFDGCEHSCDEEEDEDWDDADYL